MGKVIQYCNSNDGFIMGLLTLVYVVATILICYFNSKSAKQAEKQIEAGNMIQKQNIDMQLFEMRKRLIIELEEEMLLKVQHYTKVIFTRSNNQKYDEKVFQLLQEIQYLFQKEDFAFVYQANDCLNDIQKCMIEYNIAHSSYVYEYFRDDYEEMLKKFYDSTENYMNDVIDESNYRNLSKAVYAEELCQCMISAKQKYLKVKQLLNDNDIENVFETKYLAFK